MYQVTFSAQAMHELNRLDQLAQLQPDDIFRRLYLQKYGDEAPDDQLLAFAELLNTAAPGEAA